MRAKWITSYGMLAAVLLLVPLMGLAQEGRRWSRGAVLVTNDWDNPVRVTLWKQRGGQISRRSWTISPGQSATLGDEEGRSIRVGADDKIKVGEDWGRVDIGAVGQWRGHTWVVSVRNIWRATHERGSRPGLPPDQRGTALPPDPQRTPFGQR